MVLVSRSPEGKERIIHEHQMRQVEDDYLWSSFNYQLTSSLAFSVDHERRRIATIEMFSSRASEAEGAVRVQAILRSHRFDGSITKERWISFLFDGTTRYLGIDTNGEPVLISVDPHRNFYNLKTGSATAPLDLGELPPKLKELERREGLLEVKDLPTTHNYEGTIRQPDIPVNAAWTDISFPMPYRELGPRPFYSVDSTRNARAIYDVDGIGAIWNDKLVKRSWAPSRGLNFIHMLDFPLVIGSAVTDVTEEARGGTGGIPPNPHQYTRTLFTFNVQTGEQCPLGTGFLAIPYR